MSGLISYGVITSFILYFFIAGIMAGMIIVERKELLKLTSPTERFFLALLILFWPVSILIGKLLEETDSV